MRPSAPGVEAILRRIRFLNCPKRRGGRIYSLTGEDCERPKQAKRNVCELRIGKLVGCIGGSVVVPVAVECRVRDHHRGVALVPE